MNYDWEKIFKGKTNKELYQIYLGNTHLPKQTSNYAKKELENRNFDFNDMQNNKAAWKLKDLIEEETYDYLWNPSLFFIPYKYFIPIIVAGILIFLYFHRGIPEVVASIFFIFIITTSILINNYYYKKQIRIHNEIRDLTANLKKNNKLTNDSIEVREIMTTNYKIIKNSWNSIIVILIIFTLFVILKYFKFF